jgi:alkanesulfonate monooxygenase SsuD/methylene tetrahydromethanopterin reductase-like flavin-dependent oxidoreductase (luciferase family)
VDGALSAGHSPDARNWRIARSVFVADSQAQAEDYLAHESCSLRVYFEYILNVLVSMNYVDIFKTRPDMADDEVTVDHCIKEMVIFGDSKSVAEQLMDFSEKVGPFGTLMTTFHEWDNEALWRRSMELVAQQVMPQLRDYMTPRLDAQQYS